MLKQRSSSVTFSRGWPAAYALAIRRVEYGFGWSPGSRPLLADVYVAPSTQVVPSVDVSMRTEVAP